MVMQVIKDDLLKQRNKCLILPYNKNVKAVDKLNSTVYKKAGKIRFKTAYKLKPCKLNTTVKITRGYMLKPEYVIHTQVPKYRGIEVDRMQLIKSIVDSLRVVKENNIHDILIPIVINESDKLFMHGIISTIMKAVKMWCNSNKDYYIYITLCCDNDDVYEECIRNLRD